MFLLFGFRFREKTDCRCGEYREQNQPLESPQPQPENGSQKGDGGRELKLPSDQSGFQQSAGQPDTKPQQSESQCGEMFTQQQTYQRPRQKDQSGAEHGQEIHQCDEYRQQAPVLHPQSGETNGQLQRDEDDQFALCPEPQPQPGGSGSLDFTQPDPPVLR